MTLDDKTIQIDFSFEVFLENFFVKKIITKSHYTTKIYFEKSYNKRALCSIRNYVAICKVQYSMVNEY